MIQLVDIFSLLFHFFRNNLNVPNVMVQITFRDLSPVTKTFRLSR